MELTTKDQLDLWLPKTLAWPMRFEAPAACSGAVRRFSRLSSRKKLLALIMLTDAENTRLPELLQRHQEQAGTYAWFALNWLIPDRTRVDKLLMSPHLNPEAVTAISLAVNAGRCIDAISPILSSESCRVASLAIAQHGSFKQRASLVRHMNESDAHALVCGTDPELLERCIEWASRVESGST
jgi:hypothetical protein